MGKIIRTPTRAEGGITPDEKIKLDAHAQKWIKNALRTDTVDHERVTFAIESLYAAAKLKRPKVIIVPSPRVMAFAGVIAACVLEFRKKGFITYAATRAATDAATAAATRAATYAATRAATYAATAAANWLPLLIADFAGKKNVKAVISDLPNWWRMYQGGNMWSAWTAYLSAYRDVLGLTGLDCWDAFSAWESCAIEGGFRLVHNDFCMVSDRPSILKIDAQNRPHSDNSPSHQWRDGWSLYHIHGIRVTEQIVMQPETLTLDQISKESNSEVRRIMIERFGYEKYLRSSNARLIDSCPADHPMKGMQDAKLWQQGDIVMLDLLNSTPEPDGTVKRYVIPVDDSLYGGRAGRECVAASASTWRKRGDKTQLVFVKPEDYHPSFES